MFCDWSLGSVSLPADVRKLLRSLSSWITFGLTGIATTPLECLGLGGYVPRLIFWMVLPGVATGLMLLVLAVREKLQHQVRGCQRVTATLISQCCSARLGTDTVGHSDEERGVLRVRLEGASGLLAADSNGLSDPFAEVSVGWNKVASSVVEKSLNPKWNEDLELRGTFGELCGSLKVALFDKDPIKWSDGLGEVSVDLSALRTRSSVKFSKQPLSTQGSVSFTASWVKVHRVMPLPRTVDIPPPSALMA